MPRIRTIKPDHVNDKKLSEISLQAHLFWVLSWCFSDDEGVIENDPLLLKSNIFPRRKDIRVEQIEQWIDQLVNARFMIPFTHKGEGYLLHRTFKTHQRIDRPQPSKIPSEIIRRILDEHSKNDHHSKGEESKVNGKESKGSAFAPDFDKKLILENPFSEKFLEEWIIWKNYKKHEFKFLFKSIETEQAALNDLVKKSGGNETIAREIIHQSIANGWKGFFHLKENSNGQSNSKNGRSVNGGKVNGAEIVSALTEFNRKG
jgi:hypothetical protein